jgi:hypothetical protein
LECALDDNLTAAEHSIPGSSDSLAINADAFHHRQLEALGLEVTEESLLVTRTALTQYLEQRIPKPRALKQTIEEVYIQARQAFTVQVPNQIAGAERDCAFSPIHRYLYPLSVKISKP